MDSIHLLFTLLPILNTIGAVLSNLQNSGTVPHSTNMKHLTADLLQALSLFTVFIIWIVLSNLVRREMKKQHGEVDNANPRSQQANLVT
jgi:hypothetical protein